jgi:transposase InsO family protein
MYRLLAGEHGEVRERRAQLAHPAYARPELLAEAPNEVYSWDITKLKGPATWTYFYLYVILDVFSRYRPPPGSTSPTTNGPLHTNSRRHRLIRLDRLRP